MTARADRLREYDTSSQNYQLATLVQDMRPEAGLSSLLSDGTNDYGYDGYGTGAAPVVAWGLGTQQPAYLTTDLLGSVRLASNQSGKVLGAGAYDAWGNARPNTANTNGQLLLAGLEGTQPFGYAGQYLDAGTGSYDMRAREYSPSQGQFESEDPQAGDQQEPITYDPYEYAGQMPVGITDPSGAGWVFPTKDLGSLGATTDYAEQSAIGGPAAYLGTDAGPDVRGVLESMLGSSAGTLGFWIPVLKEDQSARCQHSSIRGLLGSDLVYNANVVDRATGQFWDIEHADAAGNRDIPRRLDTIARYAQRYGMLWPSADGSYCVLHAALQRGTRFPPKGALPSNAQLVTIPGDAGEGAPAVQAVLVKLSQPGGDGGYLLAWQAADGLIVYQTVNVVPVSASGTVSNPGVMDLLAKAAQAFGKAVAALPGSSFPTSLPEWGRSGTLVHTAIGDYYYGFHRNDALFRNSKSIGKILRSAPYAGHTNPGNLRGYQLRWRPDIVNASWNDLYEIKPVTQYANGIDQMVNYIAAFNQAGVPMNAGPSSDAGVSGVVAAPGGYAVFASPQPGIILYQLMEGDFQPQQAAQPGFAQQLASHSVQDASAVGSGIAVVAGGVWCIITFCWTHPAPATA